MRTYKKFSGQRVEVFGYSADSDEAAALTDALADQTGMTTAKTRAHLKEMQAKAGRLWVAYDTNLRYPTSERSPLAIATTFTSPYGTDRYPALETKIAALGAREENDSTVAALAGIMHQSLVSGRQNTSPGELDIVTATSVPETLSVAMGEVGMRAVVKSGEVMWGASPEVLTVSAGHLGYNPDYSYLVPVTLPFLRR